MLFYIAIDDQQSQLDELQEMLNKVSGIKCLGQFTNPNHALTFIHENEVDVVFLDIDMPQMNGIEFAGKLSKPVWIVLISSHVEFGAESYDIDAIDYLIKPVKLERMLRTVKKLEQIQERKEKASDLLKWEGTQNPFFFIREDGLFVKILYDDLLYAESLQNFITLYLMNGSKHIVLVSLKNLEQQLPSNLFIRISKTHVVNVAKVTAINNTHIYLGKLNFGIGKIYYEEVMKKITANQVIKRHSD